jgi:hypothetical protein
METFLFENKVESMRARDLRNLLMQKLGVDAALVNRILDREELKEMVRAIVFERIQTKAKEEYWAMAFKVSLAAGLITLLYLSRNFILGFVKSIYEGLGETTYKSAKKAKLLMYNIKKRKFIAALALALSLLLELAVVWIQASILLSWVLSRDHILRRFMLPTLSFPISANTLLKATGKKPMAATESAGIAGTVSNFSLDMGPMLTMMALNFIAGKLDNYAAGVVLEYKRTKSEKKAAREYAKYSGTRAGESVTNNGAPGDSGNPFTVRVGGERDAAPELHHRRTAAPRSDAERIDDSLNRFFGKKQHQPAASGHTSVPVQEWSTTSHEDGAGSTSAAEVDCMPELLREESSRRHAQSRASTETGDYYAGTEDGWLD